MCSARDAHGKPHPRDRASLELARIEDLTLRDVLGVFASEAPFCPRDGATSEGDGYVVTFTTDMNTGTSECQVFDATSLERGPIARLRLPMRIASGTHATWSRLLPPRNGKATDQEARMKRP